MNIKHLIRHLFLKRPPEATRDHLYKVTFVNASTVLDSPDAPSFNGIRRIYRKNRIGKPTLIETIYPDGKRAFSGWWGGIDGTSPAIGSPAQTDAIDKSNSNTTVLPTQTPRS